LIVRRPPLILREYETVAKARADGERSEAIDVRLLRIVVKECVAVLLMLDFAAERKAAAVGWIAALRCARGELARV
jgi:hypothetical protein